MIQIAQYQDSHQQVWDNYVQTSDRANIAHQIGFRRAIGEGLGHKPHYLLALEGERVVGILPLFLVKTWWQSSYLVSLPWIDYGGLCADNAAVEKLLLERAIEITREKKAEFLELRSVEKGDTGLNLRDDRVTFELELQSDPTILWQNFNAKLRNQIRKADKEGLKVDLGGAEYLDPFYAVFCRNMRDLGTPVWGRKFYRTLLDSFPDSARIALVRQDSTVIAGGLVLTFKDRMYVPSASAYRSARSLCPNHALYWFLIQRAASDGLRYFDFGRSAPDSGTFNFKKQWVPEATQLNWQYYLNRIEGIPAVNPHNPKYRFFIKTWQHLPLPLANFLGPLVIKNFP